MYLDADAETEVERLEGGVGRLLRTAAEAVHVRFLSAGRRCLRGTSRRRERWSQGRQHREAMSEAKRRTLDADRAAATFAKQDTVGLGKGHGNVAVRSTLSRPGAT